MTSEDKLIEIGVNLGHEVFFKLLDEYPELDENDPRQSAMLLSIMTNCIVQLHQQGWTEKQLVNEVFDWCRISRDLLDQDDEE